VSSLSLQAPISLHGRLCCRSCREPDNVNISIYLRLGKNFGRTYISIRINLLAIELFSVALDETADYNARCVSNQSILGNFGALES